MQTRRLNAKTRAMDALKLGPLSAKQLADMLHLTLCTVTKLMREFVEEGRVYRTTDRQVSYGRAYYVFHLVEVEREEA